MNHHAALFSSFSIGDLVLPNRIVMAPMVRARAIQESHTPGPLLELYYVKRANAGLIVAEACAVSEQGLNCYRSTGIYTPEQVWAWRRLTDRIHEAGGRIFLQLLHAGRASHVSNQPGGATPVSPSAVPANTKTLTANGFVPVSPPRELERYRPLLRGTTPTTRSSSCCESNSHRTRSPDTIDSSRFPNRAGTSRPSSVRTYSRRRCVAVTRADNIPCYDA